MQKKILKEKAIMIQELENYQLIRHQISIGSCAPAPLWGILHILKELLTDTFLMLFQNTNFVSSFYINSIYNISTSNGFLVLPLSKDGEHYIEHLILEFIKKDIYYAKYHAIGLYFITFMHKSIFRNING